MSVTDRRLGVVGGISMKAPCVVASTAALTLSSTQVIDGIAVGTTGERVLVKDQSDQEKNGIYVASTGTWARAIDCNGLDDIVPGTLVLVDRGNTNGGKLWIFNSSSTAQSLTVGSTGVSITLTALP